MILADTSVWVSHLKNPTGHAALIAALEAGAVCGHPFVQGELLLAGAPVEELFRGVPMVPLAAHREISDFVAGLPKPVRRIGWVDMHLVYSALAHRCDLLTTDGPQGHLFASLRAY